MVLGKLPVPGRPTISITVGQVFKKGSCQLLAEVCARSTG